MDSSLVMAILMRWIHIGSAMLAVGAPFFVRFALLPAAKQVLDDATHQKLREAVNARWRIFVYLLITLFLISGFYTFLVVAPWKQMNQEEQKFYQMLFGIKVMAALVIFVLASALSGRTAALAPIRKNARVWLTVLLLAAAVVVVCSGIMRYMHDAVRTAPSPVGSEIIEPAPAVTQPAFTDVKMIPIAPATQR